MNETISNQTCTKCQSCGLWTNYANDDHHKARVRREEELQAQVARLRENLTALVEHYTNQAKKG